MTDFAINVGGQPYTVTLTDPAHLAALASARAMRNDTVEIEENRFSTDALYLQDVMQTWLNQNPGGDVVACAQRAAASWAGQDLPPPSPDVLTPEAAKALLSAYANTRHARLLNGGVSVNGVPVATDADGRINLSGAFSLAQAAPSQIFNWVTDTGNVALTAVQVSGIAVVVGIWVQATYTALGLVLAQINSGAITSNAQVDAAFAAIATTLSA